MRPFSRILVATDFSVGAQIALDKALQLRHASNALLELVHVMELPSAYETWYPTSDFISEMQGAVEREMNIARALAEGRARELGCADPTKVITGKVVVGEPGTKIIAEAAAWEADLVVVGTHGRTGLAHLLLGSVAERVVRTAPCPVLTLRRRA